MPTPFYSAALPPAMASPFPPGPGTAQISTAVCDHSRCQRRAVLLSFLPSLHTLVYKLFSEHGMGRHLRRQAHGSASQMPLAPWSARGTAGSTWALTCCNARCVYLHTCLAAGHQTPCPFQARVCAPRTEPCLASPPRSFATTGWASPRCPT